MSAPATLGRYTLAAPTDRRLALGWPTLAPDSLRVIERAARGPDVDLTRAERLVDDARRLAGRALPGVLPLQDAFLWRSGRSVEVCFAHGYAPGFSLAALLDQARRRDEPVPLDIAVAIAEGALRALYEIHTATDADRHLALIHGHLTPDWIIVSDQIHLGGLTDGLPAWPPAWRREVTPATLRLLAPEQARREPLSPRTDLHRLASLLWETLTGQPRVTAPDTLGLLTALSYRAPLPPSRHRPGLPSALDHALLRALARNPAERPGNALAMRDELRAVVPPASPARLRAWASILGAEPFPGPEVYLLPTSTAEPARAGDHPTAEAAPSRPRSPYR